MGSASFPTSFSGQGDHTITVSVATLLGDPNYSAATSSPATETVTAGDTMTLSTSDPQVLAAGGVFAVNAQLNTPGMTDKDDAGDTVIFDFIFEAVDGSSAGSRVVRAKTNADGEATVKPQSHHQRHGNGRRGDETEGRKPDRFEHALATGGKGIKLKAPKPAVDSRRLLSRKPNLRFSGPRFPARPIRSASST